MKRRFFVYALFIAGLICLNGRDAHGAPIFTPITTVGSDYVIEQSTIAISSATVTTIEPDGRFREILIGSPVSASNVYYRLDNSTVNVTSVGWWIPATEGVAIEYNGRIHLQMEAGAATTNYRVLKFKK